MTDPREKDNDKQDSQRHPDTAILSSSAIKYLRRKAGDQLPGGASFLGDEHEAILVIRGIVERVVLYADKPITLGRSDSHARVHVEVDLTQYGAVDRGVSREHCQMQLDDGQIYVTDLGSTNGTFIAGKKLDPNKPSLLRKGDELILGRLPVQVLFR